MVASHPARDAFGPGSNRTSLLVDLTDSDIEHADWIGNLPCPVIGIGKGALSNACDVLVDSYKDAELLANNISKIPIASMILVQHLRASEKLSIEDALVAESLAYATVQSGPEFKNWMKTNPPHEKSEKVSETPLAVEMTASHMQLTMNDPDTKNAIGVTMRDALCEALDLAISDAGIEKITLTGYGRVFSTGAAIDEFGKVSDPATAHWIRTLRLPAWRLAQLSERLHIHVNGVAYCAGTEIVGFAKHVTASPNAWFQLPELKFGLIPGAGGTASLPRRIGRQKTAYLAFSMKKIKAQTALEWGLVDEIVE